MSGWFSYNKDFVSHKNYPKQYDLMINRHIYGNEQFHYVACVLEKRKERIIFCLVFDKEKQEDRIGYFPNNRQFPTEKQLKFEQITDFIQIKQIQIIESNKLRISFHSRIEEWNLVFQNQYICRIVADEMTMILHQMQQTVNELGIWSIHSENIKIDEVLGSSEDEQRIRKSIKNIDRRQLIKLILGKEQYFKGLIKMNEQYHKESLQKQKKSSEQQKQNFDRQIQTLKREFQLKIQKEKQKMQEEYQERIAKMTQDHAESIRKLLKQHEQDKHNLIRLIGEKEEGNVRKTYQKLLRMNNSDNKLRVLSDYI